MYHIKELFNKIFAPCKVSIDDKDLFVGNKKTMPKGEWHIKWTVQEDDKGMFLEYYGIHDRMGHMHGRIYNNGELEKLEVLKEYIAYRPSVPGDREKSTRDFEEYNRRVLNELRKKDLI